MNRVKNVRNGISMGLLNNILAIILPFISRTIIIKQLGTEYVGLGNLFTSILQVLSLSELGFGTAIGYTLYRPIAENDRNKVNAILAFFRRIYRIIGIIILVLSIVLLPFLYKFIAGDVPADINIYSLYIIYVVNTVISYFFSAYKRILLSANQRYDVDVSIASCILIAQYVLQIVALLLFKNYYSYVIVIPIMTLVSSFVFLYFINKLFPEYSCKGVLSKAEIKDIIKNTGGAFFSKIGSTVYLSVDNIVISAFLGLATLGIYNNYYYVISSLIAVFAVVHNSIRPVIGNILITETQEKSWNIFKKVNYLYMLVVIICCSCSFILFQDFERIWAGENNMLSTEIVVLLVAYFFSGRISCIASVYLEASGILWQGKFIPLVSAIVNLGFNILLIQIIGLRGVIISSIIGYVLINFPGYMYVIFKYLFKEPEKRKEYIFESTKILILLLMDILICWLVMKDFKAVSWGTLVLKGVFTLCISTLILCLTNFKNPYFKDAIKKVRNRFK